MKTTGRETDENKKTQYTYVIAKYPTKCWFCGDLFIPNKSKIVSNEGQWTHLECFSYTLGTEMIEEGTTFARKNKTKYRRRTKWKAN